jgi:hypothetical protein
MKKTLLITMIGLTTAFSVFAQESATLSFTGPSSWVPGTSITLSVQDTYMNLGGSYGSSYWLEVNNAVAPFLSITNLVYSPPCPNGYTGPVPVLFNVPYDPGFMVENPDLGAGSNLVLVPDGSYHITDITLALAAGAAPGTYTLRITTTNPRPSIQTDGNFNDVPFPEASFVFNVVPEPSALALLGIATIGSGLLMYRRRKDRNGATDQCGQ